MKKRIMAILTLLAMMSGSCYAEDKYIYAPPYEAVTGSHAAQNIPQEFCIENMPAYKLVASDDFNDNAGGSDTLIMYSTINDKYKKTFENGAVKVTGSGYPLSMRYLGDITEGGYYAFRCRIKTEDVTVAPSTLLTAHNSDTEWNGETWMKSAAGNEGRYSNIKGTNDWYSVTQLLLVPEGAKSLQLTAYFSKNNAQSDNGTVYFDDFELYHVAVNPMEAVLVKPNYKGLIYGDGKADISLNVAIDESEGFFSYEDMSLTVKLVDANGNVYKSAKADNVQSRMNFVFSSEGLEIGDYYLQSVLCNSGKAISQREVTIRKRPESYRPKTYVDDDGFLVRNGQRTILKRIYTTNKKAEGASQTAIGAKIDSLANYGYWWANTDKTEINAIAQSGIKSHINFKNFHYYLQSGTVAPSMVRQQSDIPSFLYKVANDYKDNSVLDGYNMFDEANPIISGEEIAWANEILAEADIDHPTYGVANRYWDDYGVYTKMTDVLTVDTYPVTGNEGDDLSTVGKAVKAAKENFPNRPVGITLQGFFYKEREGDTRGPNRTELLNMMWQALCEGASVVEWYAYDRMLTDPNKTYDEWNEDLKAVFGELSEYEDILLSKGPDPKYSVSGGGEWLNIIVKRFNGKTHLFAVNNKNSAESASVTIDGESVSLSFAPLEVKKIELAQNEYLSPSAELKAMGFSNADDVFAVAEGEENTLYVHPDSAVINYCADISDGAKLYIGKKEMPLSGKITVRVARKFTVTVVAADGVTKTSKKYNVVKNYE